MTTQVNPWIRTEQTVEEQRFMLGRVVLGIFAGTLLLTGALGIYLTGTGAPPTLNDMVAALVTPTAALAGAVITYYFTKDKE